MDDQALLGMGDGGGGDPNSPAQMMLGGGGGGSQYSPTMTPTAEPVPGNAPSAPQPSFPSWSAPSAPQQPQGGDMGSVGGNGGAPQQQPAPSGGGGGLYQNPGAFSTTLAQNSGLFPSIFSDKAPPAGWFTMDDYWRLSGPPVSDSNTGLPTKWQSGANLPSTNDWRLLPEGFQDPRYFMFNGEIIDRQGIGQSITKDDGRDPPYTGFNRGDGMGYPIAFTNPGWLGQQFFGLPGSLSGWHTGGGGVT